MIDYLYDGTFEGLLTCVYFHYYEEKASGIFLTDSYQSTMLGGYKIIETDESKATKVYEAIENRISSDDLRRIYRVFLSTVENKETKILKYIRLGFKEGPRVSLLHSNPIVFDVQQIDKKVTNEVHRLNGLVRFSVLNPYLSTNLSEKRIEILYCCIEPDHDVLEFLADHFSDRFKNDPFMIYDKRRGKALFSQEGSWYISNFNDSNLPEITESEKHYQQLWKRYFETIAIKERVNPSCQKRCMPVRYWKNLTELRFL